MIGEFFSPYAGADPAAAVAPARATRPLPAPTETPGFSNRRLALCFTVPGLGNLSLFSCEFDHLGRVLNLRLLHRADGLNYPDTLSGDIDWLGGAMRAATAVHLASQLGGKGVLGLVANEVLALEQDSRLAIRDAYTAIDMAARRAAAKTQGASA
jgi:hypothetical protein